MIWFDLRRCMLTLGASVCTCMAALFVVCSPAVAQTQLPGAADPSRAEENLSGQLAPERRDESALTDTRPRSSGDIVIPGADQVLFTLINLDIRGVEAYPQERFLREYLGLLGKPVTLQQVIDVVNRINQTYIDDGYIFSRAYFPEQDITAGSVVIEVQEGRIENVTLEQVSNAQREKIQPYLDRMAAIQPFNIREFEHWLMVLNDLPGARFRSVLRQPESVPPGAIAVSLFKENLPGIGVVSLDNYGSKYAGPYQAGFTYEQPRIFSDYDQASIRLSSTLPWNEVLYAQLGYDLPLTYVPGLTFNTHAGWGGTESGSNLDVLDVKGYTRELSLGLTYAAMLNRRTSWLLYGSLDLKNARSKISGDRLYDDRLRVLRLSTALQHLDDYAGSTLMNLGLSQGLDILGVRQTGSFELSREDGRSDFTKVTAQLSRLQALPHQMQVLAQMSGQYAFAPLLSGEEYGFGGATLGRGLDPSEITGDHGVSASLELRYNGLPQWSRLSFQPYGFADFGKIWQRGRNAGNAVSSVSIGAGARIDYDQRTSFNLMLALPLTYKADNPPKYGNGESPRYLFSLTQRF